MIEYRNIVQGTSQWAAIRAGIPTASCFSKIMTPGKRKSSSQEGYMNQLLAERMLGRPIDGYRSQPMEDGNRFEENAVAAYEFAHGVTTYRVGFVLTDDRKIGCSPDRFIEEKPDRALEAKAPSNPAIHVSYLRASTGAMEEYICQLMGQLWTCEKEHVDIISFFAGMPDATFSVSRDEAFIKELAAHVRSFSNRLEELSADFEARGWIKPHLSADNSDLEDSRAWITQEDADAVLRDAFPEAYREMEGERKEY